MDFSKAWYGIMSFDDDELSVNLQNGTLTKRSWGGKKLSVFWDMFTMKTLQSLSKTHQENAEG